MKRIENFLINFLLSMVFIIIIAGDKIKSSLLSATFVLAIILIFVNRTLMNFRNEKQ